MCPPLRTFAWQMSRASRGLTPLQSDRQLELGGAALERLAEPLLDPQQTGGDRLPADAESGGGRGDVAGGGEVGTKRLLGELTLIAAFAERVEVEAPEHADQELVAANRGEHGHLAVAEHRLLGGAGERQGGGGLAMRLPPAP